MPTARYGLAATAGADGRIYAIGGYGSNGSVSNVEAYDPRTNQWSSVSNLASPRGYLAAAAGPEGKIFAIGGDGKDGYQFAPFDRVETLAVGAGVSEEWTSRFPGSPDGRNHRAAGIAVDSQGNAYVTGRSYNGANYDYATVKYDRNGNQVWARTYNGGGDDYALAIGVDSQANVFVTGYSFITGEEFDYLTVKYDTNGNVVAGWPVRYNWQPDGGTRAAFADSLAVDGAGNVVVTGMAYTDDSYDYVTVKYLPNGTPAWNNAPGPNGQVAVYGPNGVDDEARKVAVDADGNVFVTGTVRTSGKVSIGTVMYAAADGAQIFQQRYNPPSGLEAEGVGITAWGHGLAVVTGRVNTGSGYGFATLKYNGFAAVDVRSWIGTQPNGASIWHTSSDDEPAAVAVDSSGDVFVTGETLWDSSSNQYAFATLKLNGSDGTIRWGPRYFYDQIDSAPAAIAVSPLSGDVVVTGSALGSGNGYNIATLKYTGADGLEIWHQTYSGPLAGTDAGTGVAIDFAGNTYVTGYSNEGGPGNDFVTLKYTEPVDLSLSKSASVGRVLPGATFTYTLTASNKGPSWATGVTITDPLPAGVSFVSATPAEKTTNVGGTVTAALGTLEPYSRATVTITVRAVTSGVVINSATLACDQIEAVPDDNLATAPVRIDGAPVGTDDSYSTHANHALSIAAAGVLANDTDPDDDSLTAVTGTSPSHGSLSLQANGSFTYTPDAGFVGNDQFTYTASDGSLNSSPATVTIHVLDQTPAAGADSYSTWSNCPLAVPAPGVLANDGDADGDPLTAQIVSNPAHGSLALNADGSFTYTPSTGYAGSDSFTYRASDGALTSNTATVSLSVRADTTSPAVSLTATIPGPPVQVQITARDQQSGIKQILVTQSTNCTVSVPAFTPGTTTPVVVTATKTIQGQGSVVALRVIDCSGNVTNFDPVLAELVIPAGARAVTRTFTGILGTEHVFTATNGRPGVQHLLVSVNRGTPRLLKLGPGETKTLALAGLQPGDGNQVTVSAVGPAGARVAILIAEGDSSTPGGHAQRALASGLGDWSRQTPGR